MSLSSWLLLYSPGVEQTIERLKALGGTVVVLEEYAESFRLKKLISDLPPPKLALNCVGGPPAHALARLLELSTCLSSLSPEFALKKVYRGLKTLSVHVICSEVVGFL